jgi:hypothetical protein
MLKNMVLEKIRAKILAKLELPGYSWRRAAEANSANKFALLAVEA